MITTRQSERRRAVALTAAGALVALAAAAGPLAAQATPTPSGRAPFAVAAAGTSSSARRPEAAAGVLGRALIDVPFVPQGQLLCGGAAAAMVLRYHGERGASAESFAHLVRRDEGGIRTGELAAELEQRGWTTHARAGDVAALEAALDAGLPPIVLLESSAGRWHYVVVVALEGDANGGTQPAPARTVRLHDPANAPDVRLDEDEFLRRWEGGQRWMLVVLPNAALTAEASPPATAGAPDDSAALLRASERFRAADWSGAAAAAAAATLEAPADTRAWRLLGGALYLDGHPDEALDAWRRAGEPRVDGVEVAGLVRTRHPVVHELLGLEPGARLDRSGLERARRRVALLPAASFTRVGYRAAAGGWAEVEAVVLEGPAHPFTRRGVLVAGLRAISGDVSVWASGLAGAGERFEASWRPGADGGVRIELAAPRAFGWPGRAELGLARVDAPRLDGSGVDAEPHVGAWLRSTDWATGWLRWEAGVRADRWERGPLRPGLTGALHGALADDAVEARVGGALWSGDGPNALGALDLSIALGAPRARWTARLRGGARVLTESAPLDLRPGAGSGGERPLAGVFAGADPLPLLRAHEDLRGERIAHGGIEAVGWTGTALRLGLAAFADGAILDRGTATERLADVGLGARAALADLPGALRIDHAWSLTDGARRWSAGWMLSAGTRLGP